MNSEWFAAGLAIILIVACAAVGILVILVSGSRKADSDEKGGWHIELWHIAYGYPVHLNFSTSMVAGRNNLCQHSQMTPVDRTISREHILLYGQGGSLWIQNLSSMNPARINGNSFTASQRLQPGERLSLGDSEYLITCIDYTPAGIAWR